MMVCNKQLIGNKMKMINHLNYANFDSNLYEPSTYRNLLTQTAKDVYEMYLNNKIGNSVNDAKHAFNDIISNTLNIAFDDINYETILDDLMLFVDENNSAVINSFLKI